MGFFFPLSIFFPASLHKTDFLKGATRVRFPPAPAIPWPHNVTLWWKEWACLCLLPLDSPALPQSQVSHVEYLPPGVSFGWQWYIYILLASVAVTQRIHTEQNLFPWKEMHIFYWPIKCLSSSICCHSSKVYSPIQETHCGSEAVQLLIRSWAEVIITHCLACLENMIMLLSCKKSF